MKTYNMPHIRKSPGGHFWYLYRDRYSCDAGLWPISRQISFSSICADAKEWKP